MPPRGPPQAAEYKGDPVRDDKVDDVCDNLWQTARNLLILKRRDVRVVEGARLESDLGEHHQAAPRHLAADSIQRLTRSRCSSM